MKSDKNTTYIIYPDSFKTLSYESLKMSELVINSLVSSTKNRIIFSVNTKAKLIECNDPGVKIPLDIILKARLLDGVKSQLCSLLHNKTDEFLGVLKCYTAGIEIHFIIKELKGGIDFSWQINKDIPTVDKKDMDYDKSMG